MEIKYCPNCGHEVQSTTKFCGKCGFSVGNLRDRLNDTSRETNQVESIQPVQEEPVPQQASKEEKENNLSHQVKEVTGKVKTAVANNDWTEKAQQYVEKTKGSKEQTKKILSVVGAVVAIFVLWFGFSWFQNGNYRQAMSVADSYFERGEYGEATIRYQEARLLKPNDKKVLTRFDQASELSDYWTWINNNNFPQGASVAYEQLVETIPNIKDKQAKAAYEQALAGIEQTSSYQIEERIGNKYKEAYGFD